MNKEDCQCFTCRHKDEPRLLKAYCVGYREACEWFLNWAERNGIKCGFIHEDNLSGLYAQIKCNYDETGCYMQELPNIEEKEQENA